MFNKKIDISNTIDDNYNINYIKLFFIVCTHPKFISNITNILIIICLIFNLDKLLHILIPLYLTNGIIIMMIMFLIKHIKVSDNIFIFKDNKHKEIINNLLKNNKILVIVFQFILHFVYTFIIYYLNKF